MNKFIYPDFPKDKESINKHIINGDFDSAKDSEGRLVILIDETPMMHTGIYAICYEVTYRDCNGYVFVEGFRVKEVSRPEVMLCSSSEETKKTEEFMIKMISDECGK